MLPTLSEHISKQSLFWGFLLLYIISCNTILVNELENKENSWSICHMPDFGVSMAIMLSHRHLPQVVQVEL